MKEYIKNNEKKTGIVATLRLKVEKRNQYRTLVALIKDAALDGEKSCVITEYVDNLHPEVEKKIKKLGFEVFDKETISWENPKGLKAKIQKVISMHCQYVGTTELIKFMAKDGHKCVILSKSKLYDEISKRFQNEGYSLITEGDFISLSWEHAK